jgi:micrococcal nuclease
MKKLLILPLLFLSVVQAKSFECQVTEVIDGQSVSCVTNQRKAVKVRLYQIEAPIHGQYYARQAQQALFDMVYGRKVTVQLKSRSKQMVTGIILSDPYKCPEQSCDPEHPDCVEKTCYRDVNLSMIEQGYAWYRPTTKAKLSYQQAENEARAAKRGIWAAPADGNQPKPYHYFDVD